MAFTSTCSNKTLITKLLWCYFRSPLDNTPLVYVMVGVEMVTAFYRTTDGAVYSGACASPCLKLLTNLGLVSGICVAKKSSSLANDFRFNWLLHYPSITNSQSSTNDIDHNFYRAFSRMEAPRRERIHTLVFPLISGVRWSICINRYHTNQPIVNLW